MRPRMPSPVAEQVPALHLSTGEGLNNLLALMISFRDPLLSSTDKYDTGDEHGSGVETPARRSSSGSPRAPRRVPRSTSRRSSSSRGIPVELPSTRRRTAGHRDVGETDHRGDERPVRPEVPATVSLTPHRPQLPDAWPSPQASCHPAGQLIRSRSSGYSDCFPTKAIDGNSGRQHPALGRGVGTWPSQHEQQAGACSPDSLHRLPTGWPPIISSITTPDGRPCH